jgi:cysteinyl-tRNA synthetase
MAITLYNTLTRKKEVFKPIKKGKVGMYSCGPTVYWYQHIGNLRTAIFVDFLKRTFLFNDYKVKHVMNITDVDDKTIKSSFEQKISLSGLTRKYEDIFLSDLNSLNIIRAGVIPRATENIDGMIKMISLLLKKGFAYKSKDGIYFSIAKSNNYGKLARLDKIKKTKERIKSDEYDKGNVQDFTLWKFHSSEDGNNFWNAKFGKGRPGWHIECSVMSTKNLGKTFDVHTAGLDLMFPHHTNEIAQSEAATGKKFVNYWIHGGLLNMKDTKMSKSLRNIFTLKQIVDEGFSPLHYRYLVLQTHYRKPLEFSFESLEASKNAFSKIVRKISDLRIQKHKGLDLKKEYTSKFLKAINDDLNIPRALEIFWKVLDDKNFDARKKLKLLEKFDSVLGLGVKDMKESEIPTKVTGLVQKREKLRKKKKFDEADILRRKIKDLGYSIEDLEFGSVVRKI